MRKGVDKTPTAWYTNSVKRNGRLDCKNLTRRAVLDRFTSDSYHEPRITW